MDASVNSPPLTFRHVLLPLDGSSFSAAALPTARALQDRFGAELLIISVAADNREAEGLLRSAEKSVGDGPPATVDVVVGGDPAQTITARADELEPCVVCMSTSGRGRIAGALIGSVARAVLTLSTRPVVAVGRAADRPPALVGRPVRRRPASWPAPLSVDRLVACVDGSQESEAVMPEAARWATTLEMRLAILTIAEDAVTISGEQSNSFGPPDPRQYVDSLAAHWRAAVAGTTGEVVFDPIGVASGLRAALAARPAGLVAVTTHARTGLERIRLGATAADIVRTSTAPVLVVPMVDR